MYLVLEKKLSVMMTSFHFQKGILGVFQKLIASKTHDHEGFYLLNSIIEFVPS